MVVHEVAWSAGRAMDLHGGGPDGDPVWSGIGTAQRLRGCGQQHPDLLHVFRRATVWAGAGDWRVGAGLAGRVVPEPFLRRRRPDHDGEIALADDRTSGVAN